MAKKPVDKYSAPIPFACPQCGKNFLKTFDWLEKNLMFECPAHCGHTFAFTYEEAFRLYSENVQRIQDGIEAMRRDRGD
ncbi:hypothetical protein HB777_29315 [Mesorhizobium loti]|nr:hypothetical protein HB777_29315 [Mesorhizobium loti]